MKKIKKRELEAYHFIKRKIENKEWLPQKHIREQDIAEILGMSRTPIRNAVMLLEKEKYIKIEPYKGAKVLPLMIDSKSFRERIEFIELMVIHYLMKLEKQEKQMDLKHSKIILQSMKQANSNNTNDFEEKEWQLWEDLLSLEKNRHSRSMILMSMKDLLPDNGKISNVLYRSRQTKIKHYEQLIQLLEEQNYPYARREIRILLNQLILNIVQAID